MPDRNTSFLVFCVDQMQSACIAAHGHPDVRTPNIDRLIARGASFTRAYCPNPICMPSRSSIFTGLTPRGHRCLTNGMSLPYDVPTLPGALADAGYRTHAVGKLHLQPFGMGGHAEDAPQGSWESREAWDSGRIESLPEGYYGFQTSDYVGGHTDCNAVCNVSITSTGGDRKKENLSPAKADADITSPVEIKLDRGTGWDDNALIPAKIT